MYQLSVTANAVGLLSWAFTYSVDCMCRCELGLIWHLPSLIKRKNFALFGASGALMQELLCLSFMLLF